MIFAIGVFLFLSAIKGIPTEAAIGWHHTEKHGIECRRY
jgi:hypothetical protein